MRINLTSSDTYLENIFLSQDSTHSAETAIVGPTFPGSINIVSVINNYHSRSSSFKENSKQTRTYKTGQKETTLSPDSALKEHLYLIQNHQTSNMTKEIPKGDGHEKTIGDKENAEYDHESFKNDHEKSDYPNEKPEKSMENINLVQSLINTSFAEIKPCEKDDHCGLWAECVALSQDKPKQCWCVNDLERPDPQTGGCRSRSSGHSQDRRKSGVLFQHHIKDILSSADQNITSDRIANETSSMLWLPTDGTSWNVPWVHIILPVFGSFVLVVSLVVLSFMYRRRYLKKHYCANRSTDTFVRNTDGVLLLDRMNNIIKNPTYYCPNGATTRRHHVPEVPFEHLTLLEVVGEGAFGQVFKGDLYNPEDDSHKQVAVKVLKDRSPHEAQEDFEREVETMAAFDHDNILKLLGIVLQGTDGSPYMIFEYMEHGDLSELLRKNDPILRSPEGKDIIFSKADLVDVSVQIANGMCYLAAQRFVHRDLATRNCLVGAANIVKISDFGMSRDIYTNDYYKIGCSRMLPVRWMSPESIKYGRFTCESDIWAYGVVLWEIFSYGKQPYCGHTNEEVIHFLDQGILLQRPEDCPSTVYHVMLGCWKRDPKQRIAFERMVNYLTDFRDILAKPCQVQHKQHQDFGDDCARQFHYLEMDNYVVGVQEKSINVDGESDFVGEEMDDLCSLDLGNKDVSTNLHSPGLENPGDASTIIEVHNINKSSDAGFKRKVTSSQHSKGVKFCDLATVKYQVRMDPPSLNMSLPTQKNVLRETTVSTDQPNWSRTESTASHSSFIPKDNRVEKQADTDRNGNKEGKLKRLHGRGFDSPPSLKYSVIMSVSNSPTASTLDLSHAMTTASPGSNVSIYNPSDTSGQSHYPTCVNIPLKANKVNDKCAFPESQRIVKNKLAGISDSRTTLAQFDEGICSRSLLLQSQKDNTNLNDYSVSHNH